MKVHYDKMTGLTANRFSRLQYKDLKTNRFRTGKPQSILHHLSKLQTRGDSTYSIVFGSIEIIAVCDVTWYNLVEMQQFLCYVHIQDRMVSHPSTGRPKQTCFITIQEPNISVFGYSLTGSLITIWNCKNNKRQAQQYLLKVKATCFDLKRSSSGLITTSVN
jgi:hypothetical protein